jgi:hypothetical protein
MKRAMVGGILAILLATSAYSATAQSASAMADAAPPDGRTLELARQVVDATGVRTSLSGTMQSVISQTYASLAPAGSAEAEARRKVFADAQADATARMVPKLIDIMVDAYARNFTARELADLLAFYRSPTGRSMVAKTPQLMRSVTGELVALMPGVRHDMGEEVCAKITCTPAERTAFFGATAAKN